MFLGVIIGMSMAMPDLNTSHNDTGNGFGTVLYYTAVGGASAVSSLFGGLVGGLVGAFSGCVSGLGLAVAVGRRQQQRGNDADASAPWAPRWACPECAAKNDSKITVCASCQYSLF
jgi:membrane protease subunit (stomatin/prohibitin family)